MRRAGTRLDLWLWRQHHGAAARRCTFPIGQMNPTSRRTIPASGPDAIDHVGGTPIEDVEYDFVAIAVHPERATTNSTFTWTARFGMTNLICTPSTEVPGGCRFGGELMTDNSGRIRLVTDARRRPPGGMTTVATFAQGVARAEATRSVVAGSVVAQVRAAGAIAAVVSITSDGAFVNARSEVRSVAETFDVFVEIRPKKLLRPGRTISNLHVKTTLPDAQDVRIPVWIEVR